MKIGVNVEKETMWMWTPSIIFFSKAKSHTFRQIICELKCSNLISEFYVSSNTPAFCSISQNRRVILPEKSSSSQIHQYKLIHNLGLLFIPNNSNSDTIIYFISVHLVHAHLKPIKRELTRTNIENNNDFVVLRFIYLFCVCVHKFVSFDVWINQSESMGLKTVVLNALEKSSKQSEITEIKNRSLREQEREKK